MGLTCYWVTPGYQVKMATYVYDMFLYGLWLKSYLLGWDFQCLSRAFLNVSTSLAFTNSSGSSFHIVAILSVKKYLRRFSLLPLLKIFLLWPLVLVVPLGNVGATSSSYVPDSIVVCSRVSWKSLSCLYHVICYWKFRFLSTYTPMSFSTSVFSRSTFSSLPSSFLV